MLTYLDVSQDPRAEERAATDAHDLAEARALGYEDIGFVGIVTDGAGTALVTRALAARDRRSFLQLSRLGERTFAALATLLEDGAVISTERRPQGAIYAAIISHGIAVPPGAAYDLDSVPARSIAELAERHAERTGRVEAERSAAPVEHDRLAPLFGLRTRYRQIADRQKVRQEEIAKGSAFIGLLIGVALAIAIQLALGPTLAAWMWLYAMVAAVLAIALALGSFVLGLLVIGPFFGRRVPPPPIVPASELIALGERVRSERIPDARAEAGAAPARIEVGVAAPALQRLRQRDITIAAADASVFPFLAVVALPFLGASSVLAAWGVSLASNGLLGFKFRKGRLSLAREKLVPELVLAEETAPGAVCPLPSRGMAALNAAIGVLMVGVSTYRALAGSIDPMPPWWPAVLAGIWLAAVGMAVARVVRHHRTVVPAV